MVGRHDRPFLLAIELDIQLLQIQLLQIIRKCQFQCAPCCAMSLVVVDGVATLLSTVRSLFVARVAACSDRPDVSDDVLNKDSLSIRCPTSCNLAATASLSSFAVRICPLPGAPERDDTPCALANFRKRDWL